MTSGAPALYFGGDQSQSNLYAPAIIFPGIMENWFIDYHHALLLRLFGMMLLLAVFGAIVGLTILGRNLLSQVRARHGSFTRTRPATRVTEGHRRPELGPAERNVQSASVARSNKGQLQSARDLV
jgi:hypothetical protein